MTNTICNNCGNEAEIIDGLCEPCTNGAEDAASEWETENAYERHLDNWATDRTAEDVEGRNQ